MSASRILGLTNPLQNAGGQFTLLSLVIDVPSSIAPYPGRAVVFWSPEANTEGLLGRRER